jgi:hypothetical protein
MFSYSQHIPPKFNANKITDVDSALIVLKHTLMHQTNMPVDVEITKDYIAQTRQFGQKNCRTVVYLTYYYDIISVEVDNHWVISITNSKNVVNHLFIDDKALAEKSYAALLCLTKNSDNKIFKR